MASQWKHADSVWKRNEMIDDCFMLNSPLNQCSWRLSYLLFINDWCHVMIFVSSDENNQYIDRRMRNMCYLFIGCSVSCTMSNSSNNSRDHFVTYCQYHLSWPSKHQSLDRCFERIRNVSRSIFMSHFLLIEWWWIDEKTKDFLWISILLSMFRPSADCGSFLSIIFLCISTFVSKSDQQ